MSERTFKSFVNLLVLATFAGCAGLRDSQPNAMDEIRTIMTEWRDATLSGDVQAYGSIFADDYIDLDGATKATYVDLMKRAKQFDLLKYVEIDLSKSSISLDGDRLLYGPLTISASGSPIPIPALEIIGVFHRIDGEWRMVTTSQGIIAED